jgi:micrococcal nuclease
MQRNLSGGIGFKVLGFALLGAGLFGLLAPKGGNTATLANSTNNEPVSMLSLPSAGPNAPNSSVTCRVLNVFDGDTLACDLNGNGRIDGKPEYIRLLGIDAPEMGYSRKVKDHRNQPLAQEAKTWLMNATRNQPLTLEQDQRPTDRYGRVLAHVYLPGQATSLNQQLVAQGLARLMFIDPNRRYFDQYSKALQTAQQQHVGLWQRR